MGAMLHNSIVKRQHTQGEYRCASFIHQSAWKEHSANFAFTEFSEIRQEFIANSSPLASVATLYIQVEAKKSAS